MGEGVVEKVRVCGERVERRDGGWKQALSRAFRGGGCGNLFVPRGTFWSGRFSIYQNMFHVEHRELAEDINNSEIDEDTADRASADRDL
jgi:hypothetical protein